MPTKIVAEEEKKFYDKIGKVFEKISKHKTCIFLTDLNTKTGKEEHWRAVVKEKPCMMKVATMEQDL